MATKTVLVTCKNVGSIPYIGYGPVRRPVCISEDQYRSLKDMGYDVALARGEAPKTARMEGGAPAAGAGEKTIDDYTVAELKAMLAEKEIAIPNNARKADLFALLQG